MKKIGVLYGKERSFPMAFIEAVNGKNVRGVLAESVLIDKVIQGHTSGYSVIIDRISQDVPFYRAFLKNAAIRSARQEPEPGNQLGAVMGKTIIAAALREAAQVTVEISWAGIARVKSDGGWLADNVVKRDRAILRQQFQLESK